MKNATRVALLATAVTAALFSAASAGVSAPNDVYVTAAVDGNTVTMTVHNNSQSLVSCQTVGYPVPHEPVLDGDAPAGTFGNYGHRVPAGATSDEVVTDVANGSYRVYWGCTNDGTEYWGSSPVPEFYGHPGTAQPIPITVGQTCFGSACLPFAL